MKLFQWSVLFLVLAGAVAGCAPKQAPIVDMSTAQSKQNQLKTIQNDPSMPAAEKAAYIAALTKGNQVGQSSHAPAGVSTLK
ncbi:MAG TPA: hypothetical protein VFW40_13680 [Capsulimonadaceae bacterium]|nr:hypothetical protein [Capsulimonadaceae bacterium]